MSVHAVPHCIIVDHMPSIQNAAGMLLIEPAGREVSCQSRT